MNAQHLHIAPFLVASTLALACSGGSTAPTTQASTTQAKTPTSVEPALVAGEVLPEPLPNDPMKVSIYKLQNGLTVYISPDSSSPSISTRIAVRAGSRHDPADSTGLAHYLEHMLFKGTSRLGSLDFGAEKPHLDRIATLYDDLRTTESDEERSKILAEINKESLASAQFAVPNELDHLYAELGVTAVNAYTSNDQTVYVADVPTNQLTNWLDIEVERFSDPQFRLFYPELESVYEEKNRSLDNPQSRVFQALLAALFPRHPYGTQPTIGHASHLKLPAYGDMVRYYDDWYRPNNMAILLAGDLDPKAALAAIEKTFGTLEAKPLPELPPSSLKKIKERVEVEVKAPGEQSVLLAWPTVAAGHPDEIALSVMDRVVNNSTSGLLDVDLLLSQKLPAAGSFPFGLREAGSWMMTGTARADQSLEDVENLLIGVVEKLKRGEFDDDMLAAIVLNDEISSKQQLESNQNRVSIMTDAFIEGRPWRAVVSEPERMKAVTKSDVIRVANKYLGDVRVVVRRVKGEFDSPQMDKPTISPIPIVASNQSDFAKELRSRSVNPLEVETLKEGKDFDKLDGKAGTHIHVHNERSDLFSLTYHYNFGSTQLPMLCVGLELIEQSGTEDKSPEELQKALYAMGSSVRFGCSNDSASISLSGIDSNMDSTIALVSRWLSEPKVDPTTRKKLIANITSQRNDSMSEPQVVASALLNFAALGKRSRFLMVASNRELDNAREKSLMKAAQTLLSATHHTTYFGPRQGDELAAAITFGDNHNKVAERKSTRYQTVRRPTVYLVDQDTAQAQIYIAYTFSDQKNKVVNRPLAKLLNQYLGGGMNGLIFQEIREARGLAYSASANHQLPQYKDDDQLFIAFVGTQVDKSPEAVSVMLSLLAPFRVDAARLARSKESLEARYRSSRISPRSRASQILAWERAGLDGDPRTAELQKILESTPEELEVFAQGLTQGAPMVSVAADLDRLDAKGLKKAFPKAKTKIVKTSSLFGY